MRIRLTKHAQEKLAAFQGGGVRITMVEVIDTIASPDYLDTESRPRQCIAQKSLDAAHVLRVVYEREARGQVKVITFYPGRKSYYEKK
jgi:hypothetical protein